jgi:hypothetical protein
MRMDEDSLLKFNALASRQKLETDGDGRVPVELQLPTNRLPASATSIVRQPA